jgi:hypothetical protein
MRNAQRSSLFLAAAAALGAALWAAPSAAAADQTPARGPLEFQSTYRPTEPTPPPPRNGTLMGLFGAMGAADTLDRLRLDVHGYADVGYTYNPDYSGDPYFGRLFDDERGNHLQIDQLDLSVERRALRSKREWDVGGKVELIYGYDTARFHAHGLDWYSDCPDEDLDEDLLQLDLTQAFVDVNVPVGNGLLVRLGKFVTPLGYETIDPTTTPLYSRGYLFGFAKPFTNTGVIVNYRPDAEGRWGLWGGVVRGWDQALEDNNERLSYIVRVDYAPDPKWELRLGAMTGPEGDACDCDCPENNSRYRTIVDFIAGYRASDRLHLAVEALYGYDGAADANGNGADWYGAAGYLGYVIDRRFTLNARVEAFHDGEGTRLQTGENLDLYSLTVGVTATPFPQHEVLSRLKVRPEVRYDYADEPEFDGGTEYNQVTAAIEVMFTF